MSGLLAFKKGKDSQNSHLQKLLSRTGSELKNPSQRVARASYNVEKSKRASPRAISFFLQYQNIMTESTREGLSMGPESGPLQFWVCAPNPKILHIPGLCIIFYTVVEKKRWPKRESEMTFGIIASSKRSLQIFIIRGSGQKRQRRKKHTQNSPT